jgi:hypothetical protein
VAAGSRYFHRSLGEFLTFYFAEIDQRAGMNPRKQNYLIEG